MDFRKGSRVVIVECENERFRLCGGTVIEVYGRGNHKAIVDVELEDGTIGKLLYDEEYPFGTSLAEV